MRPYINKKYCYYITLENLENEEYKNKLISQFCDWIQYRNKINSINKVKNKEVKIETINKEIIISGIEEIFLKDIRMKILEKICKNNEKKIIKEIGKFIIKKNENEQNFIDTKKKLNLFLNEIGYNIEINVDNYVKFCVGDKKFDELKKIYYYDKIEIMKSLEKLEIKNVNDYIIKCKLDCKLPKLKWIDNGFYYDLDKNFNLNNYFLFDEKFEEI